MNIKTHFDRLTARELILKALIMLGLIAIVASLYVQYGSPYMHERSLEALDQKRISDLDSLDTIVGNITQKHTIGLGEEKTVYISLPSDSPTCSDLNLPSLPGGWSYHCVTRAKLTNTDGTGWIPINFPSFGAKNMSSLAVDPINRADTLNYYSFVTSSAATSTQYVLTGVMDSKKYLAEKVQSSTGLDPIQYEAGNNNSLWDAAEGLVAYLPINDGHGTYIQDTSQQGKNASSATANWLQNGCLLNYCEGLNSETRIIFPTPVDFATQFNGSFSFWFDASAVPVSTTQIFNPGVNRFDVNLEGSTGKLYVWFEDNSKGNLVYKSDKNYTDSKWHQIVITKGTNGIYVFIDGEKVGYAEISTLAKNKLTEGFAFLDNTKKNSMLINAIRFYDRPLGDLEVKKLFYSKE